MRLSAIGKATGIERTLIGRVIRRGDASRWSFVDEHWIDDVDAIPRVDNVKGLDYLASGDVIAVDSNGFVRTLYRKTSNHNFILMTEQCNSYCLMCSQPPKSHDDSDRIAEHLHLIDLIDPETKELGITGGEPTLFRRDFLRIVDQCRTRLPNTALHVLTNGRMFFYRRFAEDLGRIAHPNLVLGIPLYSDIDTAHDHIVQAPGAFEETVLGLQNLDRYGVAVEIRVVLHKLSIRRLPQLAAFIARNFPWACHVALMGLELFGLVHRNLGELWIDPVDYQPQLVEASQILADAGMNVSIYNHQLCVLDRRLWPLARKSISDWKNIYLPACDGCEVLGECGGLFQSAAKRHSEHIQPISLQKTAAPIQPFGASPTSSKIPLAHSTL